MISSIQSGRTSTADAASAAADAKVGEWFVKNPDGSFAVRGGLLNGVMHGLYERYSLSGKLRLRMHYLHGKRHGLTEYWHPNNQLRSTENHVNGSEHGLFEGWHDNGQIAWRFTKIEGKFQGLGESWNTRGELTAKRNYIDNRVHGQGLELVGNVLTEVYHNRGVQLSIFAYHALLRPLTVAICGAMALPEKGLGLLIALYCDFPPDFPPEPGSSAPGSDSSAPGKPQQETKGQVVVK